MCLLVEITARINENMRAAPITRNGAIQRNMRRLSITGQLVRYVSLVLLDIAARGNSKKRRLIRVTLLFDG